MIGIDEQYNEAVRLVRDRHLVHLQMLQRNFHISYAQASTLVDRMIADGIITRDYHNQLQVLISPII